MSFLPYAPLIRYSSRSSKEMDREKTVNDLTALVARYEDELRTSHALVATMETELSCKSVEQLNELRSRNVYTSGRTCCSQTRAQSHPRAPTLCASRPPPPANTSSLQVVVNSMCVGECARTVCVSRVCVCVTPRAALSG